jgi:hypothetical protein
VQHPSPAQHRPGLAPQTTEGEAGQEQAPEAQSAPVAQRLPQVPQLSGSVWRFTHVCAHTLGSPGGQHWPALQAAPVAHRLQEGPQFCGSVCRSTQVCPQTSGNESGHRQSPDTQTSFVSGQTWPHVLQFSASV